MEGFLLIDKGKGMTSFDVVRKVRRLSGVKKVGHGGTLDPLATGLLIVAIGRGATRELNNFIGADKEYEVLARFGAVSDTYDAEGKIQEVSDQDFDEEMVGMSMENFVGEIMQMPPKYSALKVGGRRACDIVRSGGEVELEPREVKIYEFKIMDFDWPEVRFKVKCGKGTYIRSLIHDLGARLGCGAYVEELRRIRVGEYDVKDAVYIDDLKEIKKSDLILP